MAEQALQRARRTAELVQPPAPVTVESRLREMGFGVWEGKTVAQLRAEGGETFAAAIFALCFVAATLYIAS